MKDNETAVGEHYMSSGDYKNAISIFEKSLKNSEYSIKTFNDFTECCKMTDDLWRVLELYRELVNNGLQGKERYETEKILRKTFPFVARPDLYDIVEKYDLTLVQAPAWGINTPPLATATLSSFMRNEGYKVLVQDLNIACFHNGGERFMNSWGLAEAIVFWYSKEGAMQFAEAHEEFLERWVDYVIGSGAEIIGFTIYESSYYLSLYLAGLIKKKKSSIVVVFGGPHMSEFMYGRATAENCDVDVVVNGEGEFTLKEIMERVKSGHDLYGTDGTIQKGQDGVVVFEEREPIKDISSLPFPDFSDYDFKMYAKPESMPVMSSRGCPNRCIYCNEKAFSRRFRARKAESIFNDIMHQLKLYPHVRFIEFHDSLVNGNVRELEGFCDLIIEEGLNINWTGQAVIRKEMDFRLFKKLQKSGCISLGYGLETTSISLMEKIGKVFSRGADVGKIMEEGKRAGVLCTLNFMFGLPGETEEDFNQVLQFLRENRDYIGSVNPSAAFCAFSPGTKGFEEPEKYGIDFRYGPAYWEYTDGKNNYEVRLKRFETFCALIDDLKIYTTYPYRRLLNRDELLRDYFLKIGDRRKALPHLFNIMASNKGDENDRREFLKCWHEAPDLLKEISYAEKAESESIVEIYRNAIGKMVDEKIEEGDLEGTLSTLNAALEIDRAYVDYYLLLTDIYLKLGKINESMETLKSLQEERPDYERAKVYIDDIKGRMSGAVIA